MSEWSSAVTQVPAELLLADGSVLRGDLHVQARSRHGARAETPTEFLNRSEPFFAITGRDGGVLLIARAQVAVSSAWGRSSDVPASIQGECHAVFSPTARGFGTGIPDMS